MIQVLTGLLGLVGNLVPISGGATSTVGMIINTLTEVVPLIMKEYKDVAPFIKNIIEATKNDPAATSEQLNQLDVLNKQVDDAFDAATAKAQAEDKE